MKLKLTEEFILKFTPEQQEIATGLEPPNGIEGNEQRQHCTSFER